MRPRTSMRGSIRPSVRLSVRPSVGHACVKNKENQYFRANKCQRRFLSLTRWMIASLYDSPLVHQSVSPSVRKHEREFQLMLVEKSLNFQVISSPCNHSIIMRTHRWPYGPFFPKYAHEETLKDTQETYLHIVGIHVYVTIAP